MSREESVEAVAESIYQALAGDQRTEAALEAGSEEDIDAELRTWLEDVLDPSFTTTHWELSSISTDGLVDLLAEAVKKSKAPLEEKMDSSISLLTSSWLRMNA